MTGDVTCSVVDALAPGAIVRTGDAIGPDPPLGTAAVTLNVLAEQADPSVLVTNTL